jgi:hypothetical protein
MHMCHSRAACYKLYDCCSSCCPVVLAAQAVAPAAGIIWVLYVQSAYTNPSSNQGVVQHKSGLVLLLVDVECAQQA